MKEKEPIVGNQDFGKDEDSTEALVKKHVALMSDITAYGSTSDDLKRKANACR